MNLDIETILIMIGMVATAVWTVASIRTSTVSLGRAVAELGSSVKVLAEAVSQLEKKQDGHSIRLAKVEQGFQDKFGSDIFRTPGRQASPRTEGC